MCVLRRGVLIFLFILLACGCAKKSLVVLAPDPDGTTGRATVSNQAGSVVMDSPYQATTASDREKSPAPPAKMEKEAVEALFSEALSIQPKQPVHFLLYFEKDTNLTADSLRQIPAIIAAIRERASTDISVVGHADAVGSREFNMTLSKNRAVSVRNILVREGVDANVITTTSHGKENPLIPTADGVSEPRNRRVEVVVR